MRNGQFSRKESTITTATFDKVAYPAEVRPAGGGDGVCRRRRRRFLAASTTAAILSLALLAAPSHAQTHSDADAHALIFSQLSADRRAIAEAVPPAHRHAMARPRDGQ
jgi:hypothetical protein